MTWWRQRKSPTVRIVKDTGEPELRAAWFYVDGCLSFYVSGTESPPAHILPAFCGGPMGSRVGPHAEIIDSHSLYLMVAIFLNCS